MPLDISVCELLLRNNIGEASSAAILKIGQWGLWGVEKPRPYRLIRWDWNTVLLVAGTYCLVYMTLTTYIWMQRFEKHDDVFDSFWGVNVLLVHTKRAELEFMIDEQLYY